MPMRPRLKVLYAALSQAGFATDTTPFASLALRGQALTFNFQNITFTVN